MENTRYHRGDPHSTKPSLFFWRYDGRRQCWTTPEKIRARSLLEVEKHRKWRVSNLARHNENGKRRVKANPEKRQAAVLKFAPKAKLHYHQQYLQNRELIKARVRAYRLKNRDVVAAKELERKRRRLKTDPRYRALRNLRSRMRSELRWPKKQGTVLPLIGCTQEQFYAHLEARFAPGMTWENYGAWHIDHILPCASFDLSDSEQQKKCFNFINCQPLWRADNLAKGARVLYAPVVSTFEQEMLT